MLHLQGSERIFISEDLIGYADRLTNEGTVARRLDLLLLGFSYAVMKQMPPAEKQTVKRHELVQVYSLGTTQLAIEAVAHWYARELNLSELEDESALLDFLCRVGIAGVRAIEERWEGKSKSQIQWDIIRLASGHSDSVNTEEEQL